jgi:oxygen-independent coproporphyrinogen-3 oxidase
MLERCQDRLASAGFAQYEVSAYARPGARCRHNLNYWTFGDYLGVGAGAHGKLSYHGVEGGELRIERTLQLREPRRYISGGPSALARHAVPRADRPFEFMMNALRLLDGFPTQAWSARTGLGWAAVCETLDDLRSEGLVEKGGEGWRPTALGLRFLNDVIVRFLPSDDSQPPCSESQGWTGG